MGLPFNSDLFELKRYNTDSYVASDFALSEFELIKTKNIVHWGGCESFYFGVRWHIMRSLLVNQ